MTDALRKDPKFIRSSILYEYLRGEPAFETYKNFCKVMGEDVIEYREFDCWYMKFARGNYDLTCDDNSQPNNLFLMDLPIEIIEKIVKKTTWNEVIALRQVSKNIQTIVNNTKIVYKEVNITMQEYTTTLSIDGKSREYKRLPSKDSDSDAVKKRGNSDYQAFNEIISLMKNSRVQFEKLFLVDHIDHYDSEWYKQGYGNSSGLDQMKLDEASLHVRTVRFWCTHWASHAVLMCLKPGILEEIEFNEGKKCRIYKLTLELDQWKMAKILKVNGHIHSLLKSEDLKNFVQFDIAVYGITMLSFIELKDAVLKSSIFKKCHVKFRHFVEEYNYEYNSVDDSDYDNEDNGHVHFMEYVEKKLGSHTRKISKHRNCRQYVIEYKNKVFEFKIGEKSIEIERKH